MTDPDPGVPSQAPAASPAGARTVRRERAAGGTAMRVFLTLLGAAGLIIGAFLRWGPTVTTKAGSVAARTGVKISGKVFFKPVFGRTAVFPKSAGFAMIIAAAIVLIGLAPRSGVLTRLGGALGIIGFVAVAISMTRSKALHFPADAGIGLWICLAGGVVALIGGFFGSRVVAVEEPAYAPPP